MANQLTRIGPALPNLPLSLVVRGVTRVQMMTRPYKTHPFQTSNTTK